MPDARVISRAPRGWRLAAALVAVTVAVAAEQVWQAEQRSAALRDEVAWLRTRLADKRELIARQRREMAQVASAVDRVARSTAARGWCRRTRAARSMSSPGSTGRRRPPATRSRC